MIAERIEVLRRRIAEAQGSTKPVPITRFAEIVGCNPATVHQWIGGQEPAYRFQLRLNRLEKKFKED